MKPSESRDIELLKHVFDSSSDAIIIIHEGKIVYANPAIYHVGLTPEQITGIKFIELLPEEHRDTIVDRVSAHLIGEKFTDIFEMPFTSPTGETVYFRYVAIPIMLGEAPALLVFIRDNTKLRAVRLELEKTQQQNKAILAAISDPINIKDKNNRFVWVNEAQAKVMGKNPEDIIGKTCIEIGYCKQSCEECKHRRFFENPESQSEIGEDPDGRFWHIRREPLRDNNGKTNSVLEISREVTDQVYYENKLEALHEHVRRLNTASAIKEVGQYTLDTIKNVLRYEHTGFALVEENSVNFILVQDNPEKTIRFNFNDDSLAVEAAISGKPMNTPDVTKAIQYNPLLHPSQAMLSELDVPVRIGDEVVAVINLESPMRNTFSRNDERLISLLSDHVSSAMQRIYALENMERIHESISLETIEGIQRITEKFTQDLRKPLQKISRVNFVLRESEDTDTEITDTIDEAINESKIIIEEMLSQTEAHQLKRVPQEITELLEKALELVYIPAKIRVERDYLDEFIIQLVDHIKMRQVFINLIKNAVDAMPDGGKLTLSTRRTDTYTEIRVKDTGIGISIDDQFNLFKPFYTTKASGFGLGLTYSKRVIEAHQGTILLESKKDEGTTITIRLPINPV